MRWTRGFEVALVPHTIAHTAFARTAVGDAVNLEVDLVARYVERLLASRAERRGERRCQIMPAFRTL